tara:strand:+ start:4265 stop:4516 length:252 start_codon:yes stop_codon:yes gene_type:complete
MGNCFNKDDANYSLIPLLKNKNAEIESLKSYIDTLNLQIEYLTSDKNDIHDKYYDQLGFNQKIVEENYRLKNILNDNSISYNS